MIVEQMLENAQTPLLHIADAGYLQGFAFWETKDLSKYIKELKSK